MPMADDEIRGELEKVKAEIREAMEWAGNVPHQGAALINTAIARIDKLLKHFDPDQGVLPLKAKP